MNKPLLMLLILLLMGGPFYAVPCYTRYHLPTRWQKGNPKSKRKPPACDAGQVPFIPTLPKRLLHPLWLLVDFSLPSGRNRFFIYDLEKDTVLKAGFVAHGNCNTRYLEKVWFSNEPGCGCSASGKYKVGYPYKGRFGKAFNLYGLDSTNSNAFARSIVLDAYDGVPEKETAPQPICNSLGCPMVSYVFLTEAAKVIEHSYKPILLYVFNQVPLSL